MKNPPLILIADDSQDFKEILSAKLLSLGFKIAEANDGAQAIAKAKSLVPDLIIMDIQMPNVNGTEAVLELKHTPETKDVKIIFFSSLIYPWPGAKSENSQFAQELGAATFLKKSDDLEKIAATVQSVLGLGAASASPAPTPVPPPPPASPPATAPTPTNQPTGQPTTDQLSPPPPPAPAEPLATAPMQPSPATPPLPPTPEQRTS